jgi:inner membrane protein
MEEMTKKTERMTQSVTFKAIMIALLTVLMLIPSAMIQNLIFERQERSKETVSRINDKWSRAQLIKGPFLVIPYELEIEKNDKTKTKEYNELTISPETLNIDAKLTPEERYYGIYKSIIYKSNIKLKGNFALKKEHFPLGANIMWTDAYVRLGVSDLRGVSDSMKFSINNVATKADAGGLNDAIGQGLKLSWDDSLQLGNYEALHFDSEIKLNGSESLNFIAAARTTTVKLTGEWQAPSFVGAFSPEYEITANGFVANWKVMHFNRNIPERWTNNQVNDFETSSFGVNLVDTVDHYQQNMRSAKYAIMFIVLTFVVFFFIELFTSKRIHPVQYILVGAALIIFYSLLLSISEHLGFAWAYIISSVATVSLITVFASKIFNNKKHSFALTSILSGLYVFLYVILQLEDVALLIGSIGLFIILAVIMYLTAKFKWNVQEK